MPDIETENTQLNSVESPVVSSDLKENQADVAEEAQQQEEEKADGDDGMDDLFGDEDDEEEEEEEDDDEQVKSKKTRITRGSDLDEGSEEQEEEQDENIEESYLYKNRDDADVEEYEIKEADVTLSRHIIPYKTVDEVDDQESHIIYHAKIPHFLKIDSKPFDPQVFEEEVEERLNDSDYQREDKIDAGLIDENTIRWRYSKDENNNVSKESNAVIVQWDDGSYSLKIGEEYTDIMMNDIDNSLLVKSHESEELMQSVQGGFMNKNMMFIPTSMNSKIHKRLTKAVQNHNIKEAKNTGPKTFIIRTDPDVELKALEKKQDQVLRERRRKQLKEQLERENALYGVQDRSQSPFTFNKRSGSQYDYNDEETNGMLDDDEEEEEEEDVDFINDDDLKEDEEEEGSENEGAERLRQVKKHGFSYEDEEEEDSSAAKRKKFVVEDDEDED